MYKTIIILRLTFKYTFRHFVITRKKLNTKNRLFIMVENCFYASVRFYSRYIFLLTKRTEENSFISYFLKVCLYIFYFWGLCDSIVFFTLLNARSGAIFQKIVFKRTGLKNLVLFSLYSRLGFNLNDYRI